MGCGMSFERPDVPHVLNLHYAEEMLAAYLRDPASVPAAWREFFKGERRDVALPPAMPEPIPDMEGTTAADATAQERLNRLVRAYRVRGHIIAQVDPLGHRPEPPPELNPAFFGFREEDMDRPFWCESLFWPGPLTLREILRRLRNTYCRYIGVQYMHIDDLRTRQWLQSRMEGSQNHIELSREIQRRILTRLTDAVIFEEFVRKNFVGSKSFSLEGCESLIPLLESAIEKAGEQGVKEIVLGMAHRGRLNVLSNIMGKHASHIFHEFADDEPERYLGGGDVKYHLGHSNDWETASGARVHLSLCFNPSHLEFVNPVALGRVRAKQDRIQDAERVSCMALLIHGDAAFAGEGIVQETLNLSQLAGYTTGGALHVVVNNQIGFTTCPSEGRSCLYATDVARMLQVPIFHVNGEDPESVAQCLHVAMDFRKEFKRDAFIDMYGYRRWGHNEADEPSFTQPSIYRAVEARPSVREGYLNHLLPLKGLTAEEAESIAAARRRQLEKELSESREESYRPPEEVRRGIWARSTYHGGPAASAEEVDTAVPAGELGELLLRLTQVPGEFTPHPKLKRFRKHWQEMAKGGRPLDWAAAEALAMGTLALEGTRIRFSGQDSARGTFSQRHAVWHDYEGRGSYMPLRHLSADQAPVDIINSPLSEAAVLGFEYGFSLDCPDGLVMWEAQFGDFANAGQVIIDQFLASAEDKWKRFSGLVLLLPHGFEGMGPEHASARLERFLQLCAEDNMQVAYPSTPAQYFHLLRRQARRLWRKPLVVMTPKSLLRLAECSSPLEAMAQGGFGCVLPDDRKVETPSRILMCTGKIHYALDAYRKEHARDEVALLRLEQLYPWPGAALEEVLQAYPHGTPVVWVQEEPGNMGAWQFLRRFLGSHIAGHWPLSHVSRPESASTATGSASAHKLEQDCLIKAAFPET